MATVKTKVADPVLRKKTVYDLTDKKDWRRNTAGDHMRGPIDHVAKNKAAFSNKQQAFEGAGIATSYLNKGDASGYQRYSTLPTQGSPVRTFKYRGGYG